MNEHFEPTLAAAQARVATVPPAAYARTRNALDGAVNGLSPYITHGFVTLAAERWHGDVADIGAALKGARSVRSIDEPHLRPWLTRWAECRAAPAG